MASQSVCLQLDRALDVLLTDHTAPLPAVEPALRDLLKVAAELRHTATRDFRSALKHELEARAAAGSMTGDAARPHLVGRRSRAHAQAADASILPALFRAAQPVHSVRGGNLALSFAAHAAAVALVLTSGLWVGRQHEEIRTRIIAGDSITYLLPPISARSSGGGGGGDRDKLAASHGTPPRFAREQLAPPAVVLRNPEPKLAVQPTVVGPPELRLPQSGVMGDPLSAALALSNGTGAGSGIGDGRNGGVGGGDGPGVGRGSGGGFGEGPYRVGSGVTAPRAIYQPDPEFSEEARKAKYQGVVVLWVVVGADGRVKDARVQHSLGMGLDEKALEAVRTWRFEPARKDKVAVASQINVEVSFRLY